MSDTIYLIPFVLILLIIFLRDRWTPDTKKKNNKPSPAATNKLPQRYIYKRPGIKNYQMKGMFHAGIAEESMFFIGYVEAETDNPYDEYAVRIYNHDGVELGWVEAGKKYLNHTLLDIHDGKIFAWGYIDYDDYIDRFTGTVNIPIKLNPEVTMGYQEFMERNMKLRKLKELDHPTIDEELHFLNMCEKQIALSKKLPYKEHLMLAVPFKQKLISVSTRLEKTKDWSTLTRLSEFEILIGDLNQRSKEAILKRIEKAFLKIANDY